LWAPSSIAAIAGVVTLRVTISSARRNLHRRQIEGSRKTPI
jgi:hypothetical protein